MRTTRGWTGAADLAGIKWNAIGGGPVSLIVRWQETIHRVVKPAAWKSGRWVLPVLPEFDAENLVDLRRQIVRFRRAKGLEPQVT